MDKFLSFVAEIMGEDASKISMETRYKEGKWDSLMMLNLVMELEAEYGIAIPMEGLGKIKTMADLYEFVK